MKSGKKLLSLLLAVLLVACCLPLSAGAEETGLLESEPNNTMSEANALPYIDWMFGSLDSAADRDYFSFVVQRANFELYVSSEIPCILHVYAASGEEIFDPIEIVGGSMEEITDSWLFYDFEKGETCYLAVEPLDGKTGDYALSLEDIWTPFTDIKTHWGRDSIEWSYSQGLFNGVTEDRFDPNGVTKRGMVATVLHRLAGEPSAAGSAGFSDVASGAYYEKAVNWAAENEIVTGRGNGKFDPNGNVTRQELAVMLYRFKGSPNVTDVVLDFPDADKVSGFAADAMKWAVEQGIITGRSNGSLDPKGNATRAEVSAMLQRFDWLDE